jgi:hypothetical protein
MEARADRGRGKEKEKTMEGSQEGREGGAHTARAPLASAAALVAGLVLAAGASATPSGYAFSPDTAKAGQGFTLRLTGDAFDCATAFSGAQAIVAGDTLRLSFLPQQLPKGCGDTSHTYGPSFPIPPLKAGSYRVRVDRLDRDAAVDAGTLVAIAHPDWYLKQRDVAANLPFTLQLLRDDVGNCQTSFSHDSTYVMGGSIFARFVLESHPERVCAKDLRPFGPDFPMPALAPGLYPVVVQQLAPCQVAEPACLLPVRAPYPTDTLVVSVGLVTSLSALRAGAPRIEVRGGFAYFSLPEGVLPEAASPAGKNGAWRAEWIGLDGRVLAGARVMGVAGAPGDRVAIPWDRTPGMAPVLLRLTSPAGARRYLDLVR